MGAPARDGDIWVMDASTGALTNVTDDGIEGALIGADVEPTPVPVHVDVRAAWSPDGRRLGVARSTVVNGVVGGIDLVSVDVATGEVETLIAGATDDVTGVWGLVWSADGERLFASLDVPRDESQSGVWEVVVATGGWRRVLPNDPEDGPAALIGVTASGDAGLVISPHVAASMFGTREHLAVVDVESGSRSAVGPSSPGAVVHSAALSPDGTRVLYTFAELRTGQLFVRELPDGKPELVAQLDERPALTTILGGGVWWADDGTVLISTGLDRGILLHLDPGDVGAPIRVRGVPTGGPSALG